MSYRKEFERYLQSSGKKGSVVYAYARAIDDVSKNLKDRGDNRDVYETDDLDELYAIRNMFNNNEVWFAYFGHAGLDVMSSFYAYIKFTEEKKGINPLTRKARKNGIMTVQGLATCFLEMYLAEENNKSTMPALFGVKYAKEISMLGAYTAITKDVVWHVRKILGDRFSESYVTEMNKGVVLSRFVIDKEQLPAPSNGAILIKKTTPSISPKSGTDMLFEAFLPQIAGLFPGWHVKPGNNEGMEKRINVLLEKEDNLKAIKIVAGKADTEDVSHFQGYIGQEKKAGEKITGIIIAGGMDETAKNVLATTVGIEIWEYSISFSPAKTND